VKEHAEHAAKVIYGTVDVQSASYTGLLDSVSALQHNSSLFSYRCIFYYRLITMAEGYQPKADTEPFVLKLPHPYLTAYQITNTAALGQPKNYRIELSVEHTQDNAASLPTPLHHDSISFSDIAFVANNDVPPKGDNSSWARARRSPFVTISWSGDRPSVPQLWLVAYALVSLHPLVEQIRVLFSGTLAASLATDLYTTGLFAPHPRGPQASALHDGHLLLRGTFWQGAASPFGTRPVWAPHLDSSNLAIEKQYPPFPYQNAPNTQFPAVPRHTMHPLRRPKPVPGSIIYSRWIPHLQEHFTLIALDYTNEEHLRLFNVWQNDPRVAAGWNETGTLKQHREYLRKLHEDPHVLTMLAAFDNVLFAYYEVYWAMVSIFLSYSAPTSLKSFAGGSHGSSLLSISLRSGSTLPGRRLSIQRPIPCLRLVVGNYALYVSRRAKNMESSWRTGCNKQHSSRL
jgi:hypothetical protein